MLPSPPQPTRSRFRLADAATRGLAVVALTSAAVLLLVAAAGAAEVRVIPDAASPPRAVTVVGLGFAGNARVSVHAGKTRIGHVRADRRGRFRTAVRLRRRGRGLVVRARGRRFVLPRSVTSGAAPLASAAVASGRRGLLLTPYRGPAGATRIVRGWGWPRRARATARIAGRRLSSARISRRGRFRMRVSPAAAGSRGVVVRGGRRRLTVPVLVTVTSAPPAPTPPGGPGPTPPPPPDLPPAPPPVDPVIAAAGDIACAPGRPVAATTCRHGAVSDLLLAAGLTAVLPLGDLQYENGELSNFLASYAPTWGRLDAIAHPVPGNREYNSGNADGYFTYFGSRAGPAPGGHYSYDIGAWHLIALNSNCGFVACAAGSEQETWLRADLAAHPRTCQLAYWHHPLFNSGTASIETGMRPIWRALHAAGVDVVLTGHDHHYEVFARQDDAGAADPTGPRQFIVGTGGDSLHPLPSSVAPNSEVREDDTFGALLLTLRAERYDWRFVPEPGGSFTNAGSDSCR